MIPFTTAMRLRNRSDQAPYRKESAEGQIEMSVVIPAYNERRRLPRFLRTVLAYLAQTFGDAHEVIVVDDGSDDGLADFLERLSARRPQVFFVRHLERRGKGAAVRTGVVAARGELVLFADADGATPIGEERALRARIAGGVDLAAGSRGTSGPRSGSRLRKFMRGAFRILVGRLFGVPVRDTQCGFKMFPAAVGRDLFSRLEESGYLFDVELLVRANRSGYNIAEVPVRWTEMPGSKIRPVRDSIAMFVGLLKMEWRLRKVRDRSPARPGRERVEDASHAADGSVRKTPCRVDSRRTVAVRYRLFKILQACGPGILAGVTFGDWVRLLRDNHYAIDARCAPRAAVVSAASVFTSLAAAFERRRRESVRRDAVARDPLFILGHWRSGTTHLHNLLACDDRLIAPTLYQVLFPHTFRSTEKLLSRALSRLLAGPRRFDRMRVAFDLPNEDEFAVCVLSGCSPYMALAFPRRRAHYGRFLTFRDASAEEVERWRAALLAFVAKFTQGSGRTPLLKSPPHTCRVRLLLDLFPDARFLHVHRHPYAVFQSRRAQIVGRQFSHALQRRDDTHVDDEIIAVYREMHDSFFDERGLIPAGRYQEIAFDDLERDPIGQLRGAYQALSLDDFERVEPRVRRYLDLIGAYERNDYTELPVAIRERLAREWRRSLDEWRYSRV